MQTEKKKQNKKIHHITSVYMFFQIYILNENKSEIFSKSEQNKYHILYTGSPS